MPFEVFRRHQKKLLAVFAILAMVSFVLSDSLPKLLNPNTAARDQPVVTLYGKTIYRSSLNGILEQRTTANRFMQEMNPYGGRNQLGGTKDRDLVDALILEQEADRLGIPRGADAGRAFLKRITGDKMTAEAFEFFLGRLNNRVSGEQLLADLADQVRLRKVRELRGNPLVTPYDVFRTFREQNERVSGKAVEVPVEKFLDKVPEPSQSEIDAMYEKYKDLLPDPTRETPGFKVPRQIQVEVLSIDGNGLARGLMDKLTETEIRTAYENRKKDFPMRSELPVDLFAGQPELTPPILRPFDDVRTELAVSLADERAQAEISDRFTRIKEKDLIPFADTYATALVELEEAKKKDPNAIRVLPVAPDLKDVAEREGVNYEVTPLLSRETADRYGLLSSAEAGIVPLSGGPKFAEEMFDSKKGPYEPEEFTDRGNTRYLARKIKDVPPHVPPFGEVRLDVGLACRTARARDFAEKAASDLAEQLKKKGGPIKETSIDGYRVLTIPPLTRRQPRILPGRFDTDLPEETPIPDITYPGESFRDTYFNLQPGSIAVAPNQPRSNFYVMALDRRDPATFAALYAPYGDQRRYEKSTRDHEANHLDDEWMGWLRQKAGLKADWVPPDEARSKASSDDA